MCMERLTATAKWMRPNEVPKGDAAGAKAAALAAMTRGHSLFLPSGRQTVHGDARSPNILMRRAEAKGEATTYCPGSLMLLDLGTSFPYT